MSPTFRRSLIASTAVCLSALPALAEVPDVVTDIPAVAGLVGQVMGDLGSPTVLMQAGGDPHHYQLRPSQARSLQNADLLVWIGPELAPWLERPAKELPAEASLPLLTVPQTHLRQYAAGHDGHEHEEGHDHNHDHDHDHDHEEGEHHHHSGTDPHAWLDPENGKLWLGAIAEALAKRDPEHAETYRANAAQGVQELTALDTQLQADLAPAKGKHFVVFHDAYGYFTQHFGLEPAIPVSLGDASTPSAARLREIQAQIREAGAQCAFPEANHDPKLLHVVIEGSGARDGGALAPEGSAAVGNGYADILRAMGKTFADCLSK
ncbi:zinc ABC transporter substrate-binding protein [Paracoccus shanxieyensis]|uniref:High-affinity zinc uptake system protein ZnuA n=1 Tax=Paracoccus shanxieyensis TaxID=2675752 RepID=A0A6L6IXN0_9RHOB|nr:zinc ABC transporter substrate-binding protein [Paracoccus shanxieyensis]MTH64619.1 zinc ABC transporter substrate-binding protein [Paracoccus shanxieyensis]MTH87763.1 zinc ABC transporter substrate-binding protein [Paracoccus shanxieyensis]